MTRYQAHNIRPMLEKGTKCVLFYDICLPITHFYQVREVQGGRTWQAFGGGKHGHETFRQARIYNFRDKCVVFARNLKFSNLTQ